MRASVLILLFVCFSWSICFANTPELNIVPQPKSVSRLKGEFKLNYKTKIVATDELGRESAGILNDLLMKNYGFKLEFVSGKTPSKNYVSFAERNREIPATSESYELKVTPKSIGIGGSDRGQFYALQTLMQLLPVDFKGEAVIPAVNIIDNPRFSYRGMHLDTARHFMPLQFVKKYIDLMAQYKFNQFHWHLTDDQGWRIEIKKYPRLTEIGSKRTESVKARNLNPYIGDGVPVSGFYTQEQIKEVVAYAKARKINVIPEIELPGHASAALAAYPELGCRNDYEYKVQTTWGIFKEVFCPTDVTFGFLEDVLSETIQLFPDSPYIHIGGDEVLKDFWKDSAFVQALKAEQNLKDEHEVQSYFVRRMEKFVNSKGVKIIGWDEILEGGTAPNATIMSWRGEKGGIAAAKAKHDVIMTPNTFLYFDYGQGDPQYEPLSIGGYIPLEKVYSYNPQPAELTEDEKKYVLGAQANIWTEYLKTPSAVEYMAFPRMLALAEVNWSPNESKNYADFSRRMTRQYQSLDKQSINYRIPAPIGLENRTVSDNVKQLIELKSQLNDGKIFYTLDGSQPTEYSMLYQRPLIIGLNENQKVELRTIVVNAKGRKSGIYAATLLRRSYLDSVKTKDHYNNVRFSYYKNSFKSTAEMEKSAPIEQGRTQSIMLAQFAKKQDLKEPFGVIFDGLIRADSDAIYEFQLESDDGAVLLIGDEVVVDNDGLHAPQAVNGLVPLRKGFHRIRLKYIQDGGDAALILRWGIKGQGLTRIYGGELFN